MEYQFFKKPSNKKIRESIKATFGKLEALMNYSRNLDDLDIDRWLFFGRYQQDFLLPYGFIGYTTDDKQLYIQLMQIDKRVQRQGKGAQSFNYLVTFEDPSIITLEADERSEEFWKRQGFKTLETRTHKGEYIIYTLQR